MSADFVRNPAPWQLKKAPTPGGADPVEDVSEDPSEDEEEVLVCATCEHAVTSPDARISMSGAHEHTFTNPHGVTFHIACFSRAPGAVSHGAGTTDYTWFPGYAWRIATCRNCGIHLGWEFAGDEHRFHGLIADRLRSG